MLVNEQSLAGFYRYNFIIQDKTDGSLIDIDKLIFCMPVSDEIALGIMLISRKYMIIEADIFFR